MSDQIILRITEYKIIYRYAGNKIYFISTNIIYLFIPITNTIMTEENIPPKAWEIHRMSTKTGYLLVDATYSLHSIAQLLLIYIT